MNDLSREVFEADEARRRARRAHGDDSDDSTVGNDDDEENRNDGSHIIQVGQGNIDLEDKVANEETIEDTIEATIRHSTTSMFRRILMFSDGASNSIYDNQMITSFDTLRELDDDTIKETCRAIKKPGGAAVGYQIFELSVTRFKLFAFWARHSQCPIVPLGMDAPYASYVRCSPHHHGSLNDTLHIYYY